MIYLVPKHYFQSELLTPRKMVLSFPTLTAHTIGSHLY